MLPFQQSSLLYLPQQPVINSDGEGTLEGPRQCTSGAQSDVANVKEKNSKLLFFRAGRGQLLWTSLEKKHRSSMVVE